MVSYPLLIGSIGMLFILVAFVFDEFVETFNRNTFSYNVLNIIGSTLLLYYALSLRGWPFVILNAVWLSAAIIKLGNLLARRQ